MLILGSTLLYSATVNYTTFFGPILYSPGFSGSKTYKVNFNAPVGSATQINALLSIKNGDGRDIVFEKCGRFQFTCLCKNLLKEIEVLLLRPSAVTVSINNAVIFSKGDYDAKKGIFEKSFVAKKTNVMEVKVQGSFLSNVTLSAKASSANLPPLADFTYSATDYIAPATVNFSGLLSRDQDSGYIAAYEWNFGDGSFGSGSLISHVYSNPGNYNAVLTIIDNAGAKGSKTQVVNIKANQLPVARFNIVPKTALGELRVEVDGSASSDADGTIESYTINWNDGSNEESTADYPRFDHVYAAAGQKQITLKVKDSRGGLGTSTQTVLVQDSTAPILSITSPVANSKIRGEVVSISGASNEMLASVVGSINETEFPLTVSPDGRSFSGSTTVNTEGSKTLQIKGTDNAGNIANVSVSFTIELNKAPLAKLVAPTVVSNGDVATFDASSSKDEDGTIVKYIVNFQDGSNPVEQTSPVFQHSFNQQGYFDVSLQIIDNEGGSATASARVYVNAKPVPTFVATAIGNGLEMQFDAKSTTDSNLRDFLSYSWNFGDGTTGAGVETKHLYSTPGKYSVKLTVSDGYISISIINAINVLPTQPIENGYPRSEGMLSLKEKFDQKFNAIGTSITLVLDDADFGNNSVRDTQIWINDNLTGISPKIVGHDFIVENLLIDGLNRLRIVSFDSENKALIFDAEIWAGTNTIKLNPILDGQSSPGPLDISAILPDQKTLSFSSLNGIVENVPSEKIVFYALDSNLNSGVSIFSGNNLSLQLDLRPQANAGSPDNNDFSQGLNGWVVSGAVTSITPHNENNINDQGNDDLSIRTNTIAYVKRTLTNRFDSNMNWMRFKFSGTNPDDSYVLVFRGATSKQVKISSKNLRYFGLLEKTENSFSTNWIEDAFQLGMAGEPVDIEMYFIPAIIQANSSFFLKKEKDYSLLKTFSNFLKVTESLFFIRAQAASGTLTAVVDYVDQHSACVQKLDLLDYGSPLLIKNNNTDLIKHPLKYLSIGEFPQSYGKVRVGARVRVCYSNSVREWKLKTIINGEERVLDTQIEDIPPDMPFDIVFSLDNSVLTEMVSSLGTDENVDLIFSAAGNLPTEKSIPIRSMKIQVLVNKQFNASKYRFGNLTRDSKEGGDDWMAPWMEIFFTEFLEAYKGSIKFNDISNMNGGFFIDHLGHETGMEVDINIRNYQLLEVPADAEENPNTNNPVESQEAIEKSLDLFNDYGIKITNAFILHGRPEPAFEYSNEPFDPDLESWNRMRYECINNRLLRNFLTSSPRHGDHFHINFSKTNKTTNDPGPNELKVSVGTDGILNFQPSIFAWHGDIQYEAYFEKNMDGYIEYVPLIPNKNPLGTEFGKIKLKILKIKKGAQYNYSCSTDFKSTTSLANSENNKPPKYIYLHIRKEGNCGGAYLTPIKAPAKDINPEDSVGWKADMAVVENAKIGIGSYICDTSTVKQNSEVYGGNFGFVEIINSNISGGSLILGNYSIKNSNIDHADIETELISESFADSELTKVFYTDIKDLTSSPVVENGEQPMHIYGNVNLNGTINKPIKIEMTSSPISVGQNSIPGTQIFGIVQPVNIQGGTHIRNALIGSTDSSLYSNVPIEILEDSIIDQSYIYGNVRLSDGAKIEFSQVGAYAENSAVISARKPASKSSAFSTESSDPILMKISVVGSSISSNSNINGYGTIVGNQVRITNSQVYDSMNISGKTIVDRSTIKSSTISDATIEAESQVEASSITEESTVSSSYVSGGILLNKAKITDSSNVLGTINDSEVTNNSGISDSNIINKSKINGSAVTLGSTIDNSEVLSNSNISSSIVSDKSHINNSSVALSSTVIDSTLNENSGVSQSKAISSIVTSSEVVKSGTVVNVTLTNGSIVDGSTVTNCPNIEHSRITEVSEVVESALTGSEIQKSTIKNSTVVDSFVRLSQVIEGSIIRNSSSISESIVKKQSILNSAGLAGTTSDHSIVHSSSVHLSSAKDSSITNSNLVNSTLDIGFTNSIYGSELTITDSTLNPYLYGLVRKAFFQQTCNERYNATTVNYDYVCVSGNGPSIP